MKFNFLKSYIKRFEILSFTLGQFFKILSWQIDLRVKRLSYRKIRESAF